MQNIGFVGLGHMGMPMANNLLQAGYQVFAFDINQDALTAIADKGAKACQSLTEVAKAADVIFTMLQSGEQVSQVCLGDDGLFAGAKEHALFIDTSSIDVETSRAVHQHAKEAGFSMLDAPVSGGVLGAENATLTIMVGGDETTFARGQAFLSKLGKNVIHAGPAGNGQVAKICNNMILGISMIAVSEAFSLAVKLGLEAKKLFEISSNASGQCWSMTSYSPVPGLVDNVPSNNNYQPGFTAAMMLKDLKLSQSAADSAASKTPLGSEATKLYEHFVKDGHGQVDFSGIIKLFE